MRRRNRALPVVVLAALALALVSGCAGTRSNGGLPSDPNLIQREIVEISQDMQNTEEMIKGSKAQLQVEDNQALRDDLRTLEMRLIHLESQKRALEERLAEIEASTGS
ncbi:MAG: hypothetical protein ABIG03_00660 [Candidatus Eisenbacteria bacterium]